MTLNTATEREAQARKLVLQEDNTLTGEAIDLFELSPIEVEVLNHYATLVDQIALFAISSSSQLNLGLHNLLFSAYERFADFSLYRSFGYTILKDQNTIQGAENFATELIRRSASAVSAIAREEASADLSRTIGLALSSNDPIYPILRGNIVYSILCNHKTSDPIRESQVLREIIDIILGYDQQMSEAHKTLLDDYMWGFRNGLLKEIMKDLVHLPQAEAVYIALSILGNLRKLAHSSFPC